MERMGSFFEQKLIYLLFTIRASGSENIRKIWYRHTSILKGKIDITLKYANSDTCKLQANSVFLTYITDCEYVLNGFRS
jgi:hypothetical protein